MSKYTAGPWHVTTAEISPDQNAIMDETGTRILALLDRIDEQDEANAQLMAAAPTLLQELSNQIRARIERVQDIYVANDMMERGVAGLRDYTHSHKYCWPLDIVEGMTAIEAAGWHVNKALVVPKVPLVPAKENIAISEFANAEKYKGFKYQPDEVLVNDEYVDFIFYHAAPDGREYMGTVTLDTTDRSVFLMETRVAKSTEPEDAFDEFAERTPSPLAAQMRDFTQELEALIANSNETAMPVVPKRKPEPRVASTTRGTGTKP